MNKTAIFLADGCEEVEALTIIDVLRRGGVNAIGVSIMPDLYINGSHGIVFKADEMFTDVDFDTVDMIVCPGGLGGTNNIKAHNGIKNIAQSFINTPGKYVAAICAAPSALGEFGVTNGRKATCYPGFEAELKGADVVDATVVTDGNLITSRGPATAMAFALELLTVLKGKDKSDNVSAGLLYNL